MKKRYFVYSSIFLLIALFFIPGIYKLTALRGFFEILFSFGNLEFISSFDTFLILYTTAFFVIIYFLSKFIWKNVYFKTSLSIIFSILFYMFFEPIPFSNSFQMFLIFSFLNTFAGFFLYIFYKEITEYENDIFRHVLFLFWWTLGFIFVVHNANSINLYLLEPIFSYYGTYGMTEYISNLLLIFPIGFSITFGRIIYFMFKRT